MMQCMQGTLVKQSEKDATHTWRDTSGQRLSGHTCNHVFNNSRFKEGKSAIATNQ